MTSARLIIVQGDITQQEVDVVVNAANESLLGGGGVDGAIHRTAGPELLEECRALGGCRTGDAKRTNGYNLPARWVVHTVGPIWRGGAHHENELLASAYRRSLEESAQAGAKTVAFPSISTGVYGFPVERAAPIAIQTITSFLSAPSSIEEVRIVCFDTHTLHAYQTSLAAQNDLPP